MSKKDLDNALFEELREYIAIRSKIISLQVAEKTAALLSALISNGIALIFFIIFVVLASIGLALWVAEWVNHLAAGFFIVAGCYLLLGCIIWMTKEKWIQPRLADRFIKNFFKDKESDEQD